MYRYMIAVLVEDFKSISQEKYSSIICGLQLHQLTCVCGRSGSFTVHGYYERKVRDQHECCSIKIQRLMCSACKRTHAVLPACLVPYSQITLEAQCIVASAYEEGEDPNAVCTHNSIDENNVKAIIHRYRRHWRERLRSAYISFGDRMELVRSCFAHYSAQFMQIKKTMIVLFEKTT